MYYFKNTKHQKKIFFFWGGGRGGGEGELEIFFDCIWRQPFMVMIRGMNSCLSQV